MPPFDLLAILASAFFHATYNYMIKKNGTDKKYLSKIFCVSALIALINSFFPLEYYHLTYTNLLIALLASSFFFTYQILVAKAYQKGNISLLYPLTVLSPVFIPFWATFFLDEKITTLTFIGIGITVLGSILIKPRSKNKTLKTKKYSPKQISGITIALLASLIYSIGSVIDKHIIEFIPLNSYLLIILGGMAIGITSHSLITPKSSELTQQKSSVISIILGGSMVFFSFYLFRIALRVIDVSIAVPTRLTSIIFAVLFGVILLKEKPTKNNIIGAILIIIGIIVINS